MGQLTALIVSLAIEVPIALSLSRWPGEGRVRVGFVAAAATLITHPFAWQANTIWLANFPFYQRAIIIEISVILAESLFYILLANQTVARGFLISLITNSASFAVGLLIFALG